MEKFYLGSDTYLDPKDLTTHAVCLGMTGSGKTGLCIALLEEAALQGIPALIIDPKGDIGNLLLAFPDFAAKNFQPWVEPPTLEKGAETAKLWKEGLASWGIGSERVQAFKDAVDIAIYTPASHAGLQISILNSFDAPPREIREDPTALRDRILTTASSLLGLLGIDADPVQSRDHILISKLIEAAWSRGESLSIPTLIAQIQSPPFESVGVFDTETFYPKKERLDLAMRLNHLLAAPGFEAWMQGAPLALNQLLRTNEGKPRFSILSIAHLSDEERMFFVTLVLNELVGWMRMQPGSSSLKTLFYMDEIFGFFPPTRMPPSKTPMLTLLKQARAYGLGIVLTTQNPVDLDYKGLSNCGTWLIGKLQTEQDQARVLEGLAAASSANLGTKALKELLSATKKRTFLLHSIHESAPKLFESRWAMSYLKGPLTLPQIHTLMEEKISELPKSTEPPLAVAQLSYLPPDAVLPLRFEPRFYIRAKLRYFDAGLNLDLSKEISFSLPLDLEWKNRETPEHVQNSTPPEGQRAPLPEPLLHAKTYADLKTRVENTLAENETLTLFTAEGLTSSPEEDAAAFRQRLKGLLAAKADLELAALEKRILRARQKAEKEKAQATSQIWDTLIHFFTTVLGSFFGRGIGKDSISRAGTSARKAEKIRKEKREADAAEQEVASLEQEHAALKAELNQKILNIREVALLPTEVKVELTALLWQASS